MKYMEIPTMRYTNVPGDYPLRTKNIMPINLNFDKLLTFPTIKYFFKQISNPIYTDEDGNYLIVSNTLNRGFATEKYLIRDDVEPKILSNRTYTLECIDMETILFGNSFIKMNLEEKALKDNQIIVIPDYTKMFISLEFS